MLWFEAWLSRGASLKSLFKWLPLIFLLKIAIGEGGIALASHFVPREEIVANSKEVLAMLNQLNLLYAMLLVLVVIPATEEFWFRAVPFFVAFTLIAYVKPRWRPMEISIVLSVAVASSFVFGYAHGSLGNVLVQGSFGLVFSVVFLKWSSFGLNLVNGWVASTIVHGAFNIVAIGMALMEGSIS